MGFDKDYILRKLRKHTKIDSVTNCWLWTGCLSKGGKSEGYGRVLVGGTVFYVHRLSAHVYYDMPVDKGVSDHQALHRDICPNKSCWNPDHLYVGYHSDNMEDRDRVGK